MNLPDITPNWKYYDYWKPVEAGEVEPDEWQTALMEIMQKALDNGLFYTVDVEAWIKANNDFIPAEWWSYQYPPPKTQVEGGIMGMELYSARSALDKKRERDADAEALKHLSEGQVIGTMSVNNKRVNKCAVLSIRGREIVFSGVLGRYQCTFHTSPRYVQGMIEKAIKRGWRKQ